MSAAAGRAAAGRAAAGRAVAGRAAMTVLIDWMWHRVWTCICAADTAVDVSDFVAFVVSVSRVCRAWRAATRNAIDCVVVHSHSHRQNHPYCSSVHGESEAMPIVIENNIDGEWFPFLRSSMNSVFFLPQLQRSEGLTPVIVAGDGSNEGSDLLDGCACSGSLCGRPSSTATTCLCTNLKSSMAYCCHSRTGSAHRRVMRLRHICVLCGDFSAKGTSRRTRKRKRDSEESSGKSTPVVFECNSACRCTADSCWNRAIQRGAQFPLIVRKHSAIKGWALFAGATIPRGAFVIEYTGDRLVSAAQARQRRQLYARLGWAHTNFIFVVCERPSSHGGDGGTKGNVLVTRIDATLRGSVARFVNHSCEPNLLACTVRVESMLLPHIAFFAARDIPRGSELTISYGHGKGDRPCHCLASNCCGTLPYDSLPDDADANNRDNSQPRNNRVTMLTK